jgi:hypothetical protein
MVTTHALFAMKVQHKLRNGVAGRIISGSAESGQNLPISAMLLDPQNVRAEMPAEIDQLGIAGAAAQTRMVSAGEFWPSQQELSRDLKYMARARIPEFESYMPSHAVWSLWDMSRLQNYVPEGPSASGLSARHRALKLSM